MNSVTECDGKVITEDGELVISIHALRYRVRYEWRKQRNLADPFQSTHSVTECDSQALTQVLENKSISIHALRYRVRSTVVAEGRRQLIISIHALRYRVRYYII